MDKETHKHKIKKEYLDLVKTYVEKLKDGGLPVEEAFIFGSTVKGNSNKWSDIDTCIVSKAFGEDRLKNRVFLMRKADEISYLIEPHPFSPEDFRDKYNTLASEVKKWGVKVA